jgi:hypothetical protein
LATGLDGHEGRGRGLSRPPGDDRSLAQLVPNLLLGRPGNNNGPIGWIEPEIVDLLEADWSSGRNRIPTFSGRYS